MILPTGEGKMMYTAELELIARERHAQLLREAEERRLVSMALIHQRRVERAQRRAAEAMVYSTGEAQQTRVTRETRPSTLARIGRALLGLVRLRPARHAAA